MAQHLLTGKRKRVKIRRRRDKTAKGVAFDSPGAPGTLEPEQGSFVSAFRRRRDAVFIAPGLKVEETKQIDTALTRVLRAATDFQAVQVMKLDEELQIVWAEVYVPMCPDTHGDFMMPEEIRKAAHSFMASGMQHSVDVMHDNDTSRGLVVVESFIARKEDQIFVEGAWVVGAHIPDPDIWARIKKGELNGFSMEALVVKQPRTIKLEIPAVIRGTTQEADNHTHDFFVTFAEDGTFLGGSTDKAGAEPHDHKIERGTITEEGGLRKHAHRYSFVETMVPRTEALSPEPGSLEDTA